MIKNQKCVPCKICAPVLKGGELNSYLANVPEWKISSDGMKIIRGFEFDNFSWALEFVNQVGQVAEQEGHHPDICIYDYKKVRIELWTHKIGGLHQNDFILASKISELQN